MLHLIPLLKKNAKNFWSNEKTASGNNIGGEGLCESVFFVFIVRVKSAFAFMGKKVFAKNKEAVVIYGFILLLWIFRVVMAIVCPCPPESNVWMSYGQLGGSVIVMFLLLAPFIRITVAMRESKKGGN